MIKERVERGGETERDMGGGRKIEKGETY